MDFTGRTLVALGAVMAGAGSVMSGVASLRKCGEKYDTRNRKREAT